MSPANLVLKYRTGATLTDGRVVAATGLVRRSTGIESRRPRVWYVLDVIFTDGTRAQFTR